MRKILFVVAAGGVAVLAGAPAPAFVPNPGEIAASAAAVSNTIEIKRPVTKPRPPGWSKGRKKGWGRGYVPPGQRR